MKMYGAKDVDAYIANSPKGARPNLIELRKLVKSTIPLAEEKISWGVPFYSFFGPLVGFASFKEHVSFGLGLDDLQAGDRESLEKKGFVTGKKVVQIRFDQKVPIPALKKILLAQVRLNKAKKAKK